jgi:hypothetical protein
VSEWLTLAANVVRELAATVINRSVVLWRAREKGKLRVAKKPVRAHRRNGFGQQGRIKPRAQVGFLGVWVYRPLTRQSGGGIFFFEITPVTY